MCIAKRRSCTGVTLACVFTGMTRGSLRMFGCDATEVQDGSKSLLAYVPDLESALTGLVAGDRVVKLVPGTRSPYSGVPEITIHATVSDVSVLDINFRVFGWHQVRTHGTVASFALASV